MVQKKILFLGCKVLFYVMFAFLFAYSACFENVMTAECC